MYRFLILTFFIISAPTHAQSFDFNIDHSSLIVNNLDATADFYADILQLEEIPHPDRAPGFRWFSIDGSSQLHLMYKDSVVMKKHTSMHLCLSTQKLENFIEHLKASNIEYEDWPGKKGSVTHRSDGVRQIYLQDPEGYWIEVNNARQE